MCCVDHLITLTYATEFGNKLYITFVSTDVFALQDQFSSFYTRRLVARMQSFQRYRVTRKSAGIIPEAVYKHSLKHKSYQYCEPKFFSRLNSRFKENLISDWNLRCTCAWESGKTLYEDVCWTLNTFWQSRSNNVSEYHRVHIFKIYHFTWCSFKINLNITSE